MTDWRNISFWMTQQDEPLTPRPALQHDLDVDIAIIGAGYTGMWSAYYLKQQQPSLRIAILEAEMAGFGASGRNGGWVIGGLLGEERMLARLPEAERHDMHAVLQDIPDEIGRVVAKEEIACDFRKGGVLYCAARYPEQEARMRKWLTTLHSLGYTEADYHWLNPSELAAQLRVDRAFGALFSPHVATIQPASLARGLARTLEKLGVQIFEQTRVTGWQTGQVTTATATVRAEWIIPAVEGYAASLPPLGKHQLPVQSLMIATEPLPASVWAVIGLDRGQAFGESSRQVTYGQRSNDDRMIFGARGGYRFGGQLRTDFNLSEDEVGLRRYLMGEMFPILKNVTITHRWGGNLGMARRFQPHMLCDRQQRIALSGGYGGEGVAATNLGGRTLADLILGNDTRLTRQPWVLGDKPVRSLAKWEPEPLRWLGYNSIIRSFVHEDQTLANPHTPAWRRKMAMALASRMESLMC